MVASGDLNTYLCNPSAGTSCSGSGEGERNFLANGFSDGAAGVRASERQSVFISVTSFCSVAFASPKMSEVFSSKKSAFSMPANPVPLPRLSY